MLEGYLEFAIDSLLQQSSVRGRIGANFVVDMEQQYEEVFFTFRYLTIDHNTSVSHTYLNPFKEILQPSRREIGERQDGVLVWGTKDQKPMGLNVLVDVHSETHGIRIDHSSF